MQIVHQYMRFEPAVVALLEHAGHTPREVAGYIISEFAKLVDIAQDQASNPHTRQFVRNRAFTIYGVAIHVWATILVAPKAGYLTVGYKIKGRAKEVYVGQEELVHSLFDHIVLQSGGSDDGTQLA